MSTPHRRSLITYVPLFNISLPKLAVAVIFAALLTASLFIVENRVRLSQTPLASAVMAKTITVTLTLNQSPTQTTPLLEHSTLSLLLAKFQIDPASVSCQVNQVAPPVLPERYALQAGDQITCLTR